MASPMTPRFGVSDFLAVVNQSLEVAFGVVEIEGEVAELKVNQQKFVFFNLKDTGGVVNCFMTVWQMRTPIENGMKVLVRAVPKVTAWGKFSLTVQEVKPVGQGSIKRSLDLVKQKLDKEGLFDVARKRQLPQFPQTIGVISSVQAAGYADFMKISNERWGGANFLVANVKVQGDGAADQAVRAIQYFNQMSEPPEVIVLLRGGGSADDLASFNDEKLTRAIAGSRVVTLTGIGHEVDESLCDLAADVRASTPSNAAQMLFPEKQSVIERLAGRVQSVSAQVVRTIDDTADKVTTGRHIALDEWRRQLDDLSNTVALKRQMIARYDPDDILRQGYAMVSGQRKIGDVVKITTVDTIMKARIEESERRSDN